MKIVKSHYIINKNNAAEDETWKKALTAILNAVDAIKWPEGANDFVILPETHANGVKPIKSDFVKSLKDEDFQAEQKVNMPGELQPGNIDFMLKTENGLVAIEWETGNISSVHRSINKLVNALSHNVIRYGVVLLASKKLYRFLTDRIGCYDEIEPYFGFWAKYPCESGLLLIMAFEHDDVSLDVPPIPKGKDGNAKKDLDELE